MACPDFARMAFGGIDRAGFHQAVLHVRPLAARKVFAMPPPMMSFVTLGEQGRNHQDLVADLRAAANGYIGCSGLAMDAARGIPVPLFIRNRKRPQEVRKLPRWRNARDGRTKGIVDINVAKCGHLFGQFHIVLFLPRDGSAYFPA